MDFRGAFLENRPGHNGAYLPSAGLADADWDDATVWPPDFHASSESAGGPSPSQGSPRRHLRDWRVEGVPDGDTVLIGDRPAQLLGVDAPPESSMRGGEARDFVRDELSGRRVTVETGFGRDRFERLLVFIWQRGRLFNQVEIVRGYAEAFPEGGRDLPRDLPYEGRLLRAEEVARDGGRKIWEGCPRRALRPG
jgi:endonuclease YncB( thermonuclease family)